MLFGKETTVNLGSLQTALPLVKAGLTSLATADAAAKKVKDTAKEFESLLLGELLKQSRQTLDKDVGFFGNDKSDTYGALFDFFLGKHLADSGGVGVTGSLERQLSMNPHR